MPQSLKDGIRSLVDEREEVYFLALGVFLGVLTALEISSVTEFIAGIVALYSAMVIGKGLKR